MISDHWDLIDQYKAERREENNGPDQLHGSLQLQSNSRIIMSKNKARAGRKDGYGENLPDKRAERDGHLGLNTHEMGQRKVSIEGHHQNIDKTDDNRQ